MEHRFIKRKYKDFAYLFINLIPISRKLKLRDLCVAIVWRRTPYLGFKLCKPKCETDENGSFHRKELRLYFNNGLYYITYYYTRTA